MPSPSAPKIKTINSRSFQGSHFGQGYELVRHVKVTVAGTAHALRVHVVRGNSIETTKGSVARFDGVQWHVIDHANGWELLDGNDDNAPTYGAWRNRQNDCITWLDGTADELLMTALEWLI